jgi:nucleotide-binding universal stress UspA family protein
MKILIAYDGSTHADAAIEDLRFGGLPEAAEARVVSVVEWPLTAPRSWGMVDTDFPHEWRTFRVAAAERSAQAACDRIQKYFPKWDLQMETPTGSPSEMILERAAAWPADLIVVGTHGRSALGRAVLGSVSMKLVKYAPCSVRVVRARTHDGAALRSDQRRRTLPIETCG